MEQQNDGGPPGLKTNKIAPNGDDSEAGNNLNMLINQYDSTENKNGDNIVQKQMSGKHGTGKHSRKAKSEVESRNNFEAAAGNAAATGHEEDGSEDEDYDDEDDEDEDLPQQPESALRLESHHDPEAVPLSQRGGDGQPSLLKVDNSKIKKKSVQVFKKDASHNLSHEKLVYNQDKLHPRVVTKDPKTGKTIFSKHSVYGTKTGIPCCCKQARQSDLAQYGTGVALYFQFMKFLILIFFVISCLSIPAYIFYFSGNQSNIDNIQNAMSSLSLGNLGISSTACNTGSTINSTHANITLSCSYGKIDSIIVFGKAAKAEKQSCATEIAKLKYTPPSCFLSYFSSDALLQSEFTNQCMGLNQCNFVFNATMVEEQSGVCSNKNSTTEVLYIMKAACKSENVRIINQMSAYVSKIEIAYVVIIIDIGICFFLYFSLQFARQTMLEINGEINSSIVTAQDFAVEIRNLPNHDNVRALKAEIWSFIETINRAEEPRYLENDENPDEKAVDLNQDTLMNVHFGLTDYGKLNFMLKMADLLEKKKKYEKFLKEDDPKHAPMHKKKIEQVNAGAVKIMKQMEDYSKKTKSQGTVVFAQFQSMNGKDKFIQAILEVKWFMRCCSKKYNQKYFMGNWLSLKSGPEPSVINWENLSVGKVSRIIRTVIVAIITIIIIAISIWCLVYSALFQTTSAKYDPVNCNPDQEYTMQEAYDDSLLDTDLQGGLVTCYCYQQFLKLGLDSTKLKFPDNSYLCQDWLSMYSLSNAVVQGTAVFIVLLNFFIVVIYHRLSKFQKFHTVTDEKASNIIKMFLSQFVNTGLVIMLVNARVDNTPLPNQIPLFQGLYKDFTVEWYGVVGSTISFTMLINIITPHIGAFVKIMIDSCRKCCDRGCSFDSKKTKQRIQEDYQRVYIGPEFLIEVRYSQILTTFFTMMVYSSGLPLLYPIFMVQMIITYWVDKFMFLRVYMTPPRFGIEMVEVTRKAMIFGIFLHFAFGFYMYSSTQVFNFKDGTNYLDSFITSTATVNEQDPHYDYIPLQRVGQSHAILFLAAFAVFIVITILAQVAFMLFQGRCAGFLCCCIRGQKNVKRAAIFSNDIYAELSVEDLKIEYKKSKTEFQDFKVMQEKGIIKQIPGFDLFLGRLANKLLTIKNVLHQRLSGMNEKPLEDTIEAFSQLFTAKKGEVSHRLKSLYSFDIKDNTEFKRSQKIEKRIRKFYGMK